MSKTKKTPKTTARVITLDQYEQVLRMGHPEFLARKLPTLDEAKLLNGLAWAKERDRQNGEELEFEVNPAEPLDQKLMGWRYFTALNAFRKAVELEIANKTADAVFN